MGEAVNLGGTHSPNLELLLSADPDFVLASASTASNVKMKDALESAGITVAYFDVDNFEDYLNMLNICTDIIGRKNSLRAKRFAGQGADRRNQSPVSEPECSGGRTQGASAPCLLRFCQGEGKYRDDPGGNAGGYGCTNIADSDTGLLDTLSVEAVIREEPYRIFVVTMEATPRRPRLPWKI